MNDPEIDMAPRMGTAPGDDPPRVHGDGATVATGTERNDEALATAEDGRLHRDVLCAAVASVVASAAVLGVSIARRLEAARDASLDDAALALGYALGAAAAWSVGAALARRSALAGVVALTLLFPLASLGGEYACALLEHRDAARATTDVIQGARAPDAVGLGARALTGAFVLGPLLLARARRAGLAWELAGPLWGGLAGCVAAGVFHLHVRPGALPLEVVPVSDAVLHLGVGVSAFVLALRTATALFAWRDRRRARATSPETLAGRRSWSGIAALAAASLLVSTLTTQNLPASDAALRLLPWPRGPIGLTNLGVWMADDDDDLWRSDRLSSVGPATIVRAWTERVGRGPPLVVLRPAAALGSVQAMLLGARLLERRDLGGRPSPEGAEEGLDWLRRAAEAGSVEGAVELDRWLLGLERPTGEGRAWLRHHAGRGSLAALIELDRQLDFSEPEHGDAVQLLLEAVARERVPDPRVVLLLATRLRHGGGHPEAVPRLLPQLREMAWGPPARGELGSEWDPTPRRTTTSHRALSSLIAIAPRAELGGWELLAAARGEGRVLVELRERRIAEGTFGLADDAWTAHWQQRQTTVARPDALAVWPRARPAAPVEADALDRALDAVRAGRPVDAWRALASFGSLPHHGALDQARALVYLEFVARRGAVREVHLDVASGLATRGGSTYAAGDDAAQVVRAIESCRPRR